MKNKNVVYTCLTGGYDDVPQHKYVSPDWDYILFTDNADLIARGTIYHWTVRKLQFSKSTNVKNARWHKVNAHILFPEYEYSLWIDANITIENAKPFDLFQSMISQDVALSIPPHPQRNCVYAEADEIKLCKIDHIKTVDAEMRKLKKHKYPENNGLSETCIMLRRHNDKNIVQTQQLWWKMISNYSKRDQLSCNFAFWKTGINVLPMYDNGQYHRNCEDYEFHYADTHNQNKITSEQVLPNIVINIMVGFIPNRNLRHKLRTYLKNIQKV